jgi:hypothetical protein
LVGHQASLDDRLLHVPLIFSGPGMPSMPDATGVFPMTAVPWVVAAAAGIVGPWEAPGPIAVSQHKAGTISGKLEAAASRFNLTDAQRARLRRSIEQATDGSTTLTIDAVDGERVDGPSEALPVLRMAIELARGRVHEAPEEEASITPGERAEIEERLADLGYI